MRRLLFSHWGTGIRVLLIGFIAGLIFSTSENRLTFLSAAQAVTAVAGVAVGVSLGFRFATSGRALSLLARLGAEHYGLAGAAGFVLAALWSYEHANAWPLAIWFLVAGFVEGIASSVTLHRMQSAS